MYNYNIIQSVVNTKMRKKYFLFLPLDNLAGVCYTINANSKKAVPVLSPAEKVIVSIFEAVAFSVVPKII